MIFRKTITFILLATATAAAQSIRQGYRDRSLPRGFTPSEPLAAPPPSTQVRMQSDGGSLMQASMSTDPATAGPSSYSLYAVPRPKPRVLKKHDLVNIVVQEVSNYDSTGTTDLQRQANFDAKVDQWIALNLKTFSLHGTGQATNPVETKMEGARGFKGNASIDRSDTTSLRIEAEVIDVKPNGTLVVQATKHIKHNSEDQAFTLTGTCRVQDVDSTNSILSSDLHDLNLVEKTTGAVRDNTKRSVIGRILDFINPF